MVASMLASLTDAIERLEATVDRGELDPAVQAAHAARNDALMLGAGQLQAALSDLEAAARDADEPRAGGALERVRAVWPPTRDELAGVARPLRKRVANSAHAGLGCPHWTGLPTKRKGRSCL